MVYYKHEFDICMKLMGNLHAYVVLLFVVIIQGTTPEQSPGVVPYLQGTHRFSSFGLPDA